MTRVYISIGSNIDREHNVRSAVSSLHDHFGELVLSTVYESASFGFEGDPFLNLVAGFDAEDMEHVAQILRDIERTHGRERGDKKFSSRTLDLDLLLFGNANLHGQGIDVPRDEITRYAFVLGPLAEIAPAEQHPILKRNFQDIWNEFSEAHPEKAHSIVPVAFDW